tara:strand:- start:2274 stop:2927 length:654 start_codon:yes stop_codon:yes gene_type:complete
MTNNLTHELLKNCTSLVRLSHLNDLCSNLNNKSCDVYALRAEFGYPEHLIPDSNKNYIAYMGVSKKKIETTYGQAHFITFCFEPKMNVCESPVGVLEHMYDIYVEETIESLYRNKYREGENYTIELFPSKIEYKDIGYWRWLFQEDWGISDKISMDDFIDDYEIKSHVNWDNLYDILPDNIDDVRTESDHESDNESEMLSESDTEIEEGEIVSESET